MIWKRFKELLIWVLFVGLMLGFSYPLLAQQPLATAVDSLESMLKTELSREQRLDALQTLSGLIWRQQPERARELAEETILLAKELSRPISEGQGLIQMGYYELYQGKAIQALAYFQEAEYVFESDVEWANRARQEQANAHYQLGNLDESIRLGLQSLSYFEEKGDSLRQARIMNNIGLFHSANQNYEEAQKFIRQSIQLKILLGKQSETGSGYNNLSFIFDELGQPDSVVYYALQSLEQQAKYPRPYSLALAHQLLGLGYLGQGKLELAEEQIQQGLDGYHALGSIADEASAWLDLAKVAQQRGDLAEQIRLAEQARNLAQESGRPSIHSESLQFLARGLSQKGRYQAAYEYLWEDRAIRDSIFETEKQAEIAKMSAIYQTEQQEQKIKLLDQEKQLQKARLIRTRNGLILTLIVSLLLVGVILLLIRLSRLRRQTNQELAEKNLQLAQLNVTKDRLFSIVAHDLKNPLSAFRSITGNLTRKWGLLDKDAIFPFVQSLNQSSGQLYDLLQNLLQWAISETGNLEIRLEEVQIQDQLEKAKSLMQGYASQQQIKLELPDLPVQLRTKTDAQVIHTVLRNLIANALKFTEKGGTVRINAIQLGQDIRISVQDTGIGISKEDQAKLFRMEIPVSEIGKSDQKGTGLGLILSKELLDKVGGHIWVESTSGKGSTFFVSLPVA